MSDWYLLDKDHNVIGPVDAPPASRSCGTMSTELLLIDLSALAHQIYHVSGNEP